MAMRLDQFVLVLLSNSTIVAAFRFRLKGGSFWASDASLLVGALHFGGAGLAAGLAPVCLGLVLLKMAANATDSSALFLASAATSDGLRDLLDRRDIVVSSPMVSFSGDSWASMRVDTSSSATVDAFRLDRLPPLGLGAGVAAGVLGDADFAGAFEVAAFAGVLATDFDIGVFKARGL